MAEQVLIPKRFNGPPSTGHGGYSCAMAAQFLEGPAEATLRAPPPLDTPLAVERDGEEVRLLEGPTMVAGARSAPSGLGLDGAVPEPVSLEAARVATARSPLLDHHPFDTCFVCGTGRAEGDGMRLFPGPVEGREVFAAPWRPHGSLAGEDGRVRFEFVWSALDCPGGNAAWMVGDVGIAVLARMGASMLAPVDAGDDHVAIGWVVGRDGRKLTVGSAIHTADGRLCALSRALWIELTEDQIAALGTTEPTSPEG